MNEKKALHLMKVLIEKYLNTLTDPTVITAIRNGYVAGGAIPSLLMGDYYNDLDIYFSSDKDAEIVRDYYEGIADSLMTFDEDWVLNYQKENHFHLKLLTDNAINLNGKIQLITKWAGSHKDVVEQFDFEHLKGVYNILENKLYVPSGVYPLLLNKELVYTGSMFPVSSILRLRKFLKRGWTISTKDLIRMVLEAHSYLSLAHNKYLDTSGQRKHLHKGLGDFEVRAIYTNEMTTQIDVSEFVRQLNGVDPTTIQVELAKHLGKSLSINEILALL